MDSQEMMYAQINKLCDSVEDLRKKIDDLAFKFNAFETSKKLNSKILTWLGGLVLGLVSTEAFLNLITNHLRF